MMNGDGVRKKNLLQGYFDDYIYNGMTGRVEDEESALELQIWADMNGINLDDM